MHWGNHKCIAKTREGKSLRKRLGAGAAPIKTDKLVRNLSWGDKSK
jgi:predicted GH43/DUF377 family glycosyl hydrolase